MAKEQKSFIKGRMNKSVDERLLPEGEYVDALNIRLGSTELSEIGAVENSKGNVKLTTLKYDGVELSGDAVCIGAFDDSAEETMYWFVHDPNHSYGGVVDMIVSFNTQTQQLTYHVITTALLNFNPTYLMNAVDKIDDLLFFTDDYNPPRKINVTRGYAQPVAHVDQITELDISVIKPQPMESPVLTLQANLANDNFMEDTFLCFAYRYKYKDGEYSATSQFSDPAFLPSDFSLEMRSYMNAGMENAINSVVVEFNAGSENVIGIDIVFKEMDSSTIYVAKKLDKVTQGYQPNSIQSITFSNGDIYTILSEGEILRLYDNVPRLAKAQTIMGNRLMYGNYLEGYDLKDIDGRDIQLTYVAEQESEAVKSFVKEEDRTSSALFNMDYAYTGISPTTTRDNEILIDLSDIPSDELINGASLSIDIEFRAGIVFEENDTLIQNPQTGAFFSIQELYYPYEGTVNNPPNFVPELDRPTQAVSFIYTVEGNHPNVGSAFSGISWDSQVGLSGGYQEAPLNYGTGYTLTDSYNTVVYTELSPASDVGLPSLNPIRSARESLAPNTDPFAVYVYGDFLHVKPNGFEYSDDGQLTTFPANTPLRIFMIPELVSVRVTFKKTGSQKSLHSNRDYQVGIVYQDAEGRQSTVLESISNSFHVSAYDSESLNSAVITIPYDMKPPYWADRYKFVMKQTETDYETIFVTSYYRDQIGENADQSTGRAWLLLEGENANKVKEGQELYVKLDASGAPDSPIKTTVLEVKQWPEGEIQSSPDNPSGVYMKVLPDNFALDFGSVGNVLTSGFIKETTEKGDHNDFPPVLRYPLHSPTDTVPPYAPWQIPSGSRVVINIHLHRREYDRIEQDVCGRETCNFKFDGVAGADYDNLHQFFLGEGVNIPLNSDCGPWGYDDNSGANSQEFFTDLHDFANPSQTTHHTGVSVEDENKYQFTRNSSTGEFYFEIASGTRQCWGAGVLRRASKIECTITIFPSTPEVVFETIPTSTNGEVYYENGESFEISGGYHLSGNKTGDQNQTATDPAIVNLGFFNCYTFFNGVESYKIRDSITGKKIYLGNRVTAVSEQDYMEIRRGASITYSGIFNAQNNVNKLNEFNLGLANYKDCEESYGPIQVLHSRRTDILALQEDKISYVGVGKNLLTDAVGGGIITSVPEVLGTQVARIEEYGISENPESFCHYGKDVYFTDAKRSAVIQLKGGEGVDALNVVSNIGMRSWFRDLFQTSFNRQKLGGYDPYMDEYVLSPNTNRLPFEIPVYGCGGGDMQFTGLLEPQTFIIDFGNTYGNVTVSGNASVSTTITVQYNGVTLPPVTSDPITGDFSVVFDKDVPSVTQATITITPNAPATDSITIINSIDCPVADFIIITPVVVTSEADAGRVRTQEFNFSDPSVGYLSPLWQSLNLTFASQTPPNIVSQFGANILGPQGTGMIPMDNADVFMYSRRLAVGDATFDLNSNKMRYLRTSTVYNNNPADIAALISASSEATLSGTEPFVTGTFQMPPSTPPPAPQENRLYLIWDYREVNEIKLCYSATSSLEEACCECFSSPSCIPFEGSAISTVDSVTACGLPDDTNVYHTSVIINNGVANTIPVVGTTIYGSGGCSTDPNRLLFPAGFIHFDDNGTSKWIEIDSDNVVIDSGNC
jgi:hypothetical protein